MGLSVGEGLKTVRQELLYTALAWLLAVRGKSQRLAMNSHAAVVGIDRSRGDF
jgi:hypothetical protein